MLYIDFNAFLLHHLSLLTSEASSPVSDYGGDDGDDDDGDDDADDDGDDGDGDDDLPFHHLSLVTSEATVSDVGRLEEASVNDGQAANRKS